MHVASLWLLLLHATLSLALSFQLPPFLSPSSLKDIWNEKPLHKFNDKVDLLVNTVVSAKTNVPYSYYNLPFVCPASNAVKPVHMSLTEILNGNHLMQSDYKLKFGNDEPCLRLCDRIMNQRNIRRSIALIESDYISNWVIDSIPGSTTFISDNLQEVKKYYIPGFPLGYVDPKTKDVYINNHLMMVIRYHKETDDNQYSIVGFEVYPKSVQGSHCPGASKDYTHLKLDPNAPTQLVPYTYSVYWREEPDVDFNSRWKLYIDPSLIDMENGNLLSENQKSVTNSTHWVSLINSIVIISFVSLIVAFVLLITFKSSLDDNDITPDVEGLPLLSHTKFASIAQSSFSNPKWLPLLAIISGSGIQLFFSLLGMTLLSILFFGNSNLLSTINDNDSKILSATIAVLIVGGFFAGFSSIQLIKLFRKTSSSSSLSIRSTVVISSLSGCMLISVCLVIIVVANSLIFEKDSPRSMKFSTFLLIFSIYILLQLPVSIIGGIISHNFNIFINLIRHKLPPSSPTAGKNIVSNSYTPWYLRFPTSLLIIGIAPCGVVFIESRFIYMTLLAPGGASSSVMLGFIIIAAILLSIIMMEIGILATYLKLSKSNSLNNTNWQWWTFANCSISIFLYLLLTSLYQLLFNQSISHAGSPVLYIVYTIIINSIISLACGSLALWSGTTFVYSVILFSEVKKD